MSSKTEKHTGIANLADCIRKRKEEILAEWQSSVLDDEVVHQAERVSRPTLEDHIPDLIDRLVRALEASGGGPQSVPSVGSSVTNAHAESRFVSGYSLAAAIRELTVLRQVILKHCFNQVANLEGALVVHSILDEALRKTATEFARLAEEREQEQRHEVEQFKFFVDEIRDYAIFLVDSSGQVKSWNKGVERILGFGRDEFLGQNANIIFVPSDRAAGVPQAEITRARKSGRAIDERWHMRKSGEWFWADGILTQVKDKSGEIRGYMKIIRDRTERKRFNEELKRAKDEAELANHMKTRFLATVSHELRNPLSAVKGFAQMIQGDEVSSEERGEFINIIIRNAEQMEHLVNDLADLSKIETGKLEVRLDQHSLEEILLDVRGSQTIAAEAKGLRLKFEIENGVPDTIKSDRIRLTQILNNVVGNAVKFTENGEVSVTVQRQGNDMLKFLIQDEGPGIAVEDKEKLFQPFSRLDRTRHIQGSGLGLSLSQVMARLLGGDVWIVDSEVGKGTTFAVSIKTT